MFVLGVHHTCFDLAWHDILVIMQKNRIIIISGPTASGKSRLALDLAQKKDIAIINADSLQIYEGLPILSAQPTLEEKKQVKHFLYSHLKPNQISSVATWLALTKSCVDQCIKENKLPVIVGGSGMYISKLVEGISEIPEINLAIRNEARNLYEELGRENFILELIKLGEEEKIIKLDKQRLIRAYEVLKQTKKPISFWQNIPPQSSFSNYNFLHINLNPNREELYKNCNLRFEIMLKNGAIEEVAELVKQGAATDWPITKTLGFTEINAFLKNEINYEKMLEISAQKTRNYAKRQLTWFRHQLPEKLVFNDFAEALKWIASLRSQ